MDPRKSSEAFIKALKGKETSVTKIELATEGWHSRTLYLPGKHSVIADWVIQALCEAGSHPKSSPAVDSRYWRLLADIIASQDTKTTNSWLTPILARRSILPVFALILPKLRTLPDLVAPFAAVYRHALPLALPKAQDDFVLSCLCTPLDSIYSEPTTVPDPTITSIWLRGLEAFRLKFGQVKDKRRVISSFLEERLLKCAHANQSAAFPEELRTALRSTGDLLLFGTTDGLVMAMEAPSDTPSSSTSPSAHVNTFFSSLQRSLERDNSIPVLSLFPDFLRSFTESVQRSHLDISQILNRSVTSDMRVRVAATHFFANCLSGPLSFSLSTPEDKRPVMETRLQLLRVMKEEGYLDMDDLFTMSLVKREIDVAIGGLDRDDTRDAALDILTTVLSLDFHLIDSVASIILTKLSELAPTSFRACNTFLSTLLSFHCKTRTIQTHIHGLVDCVVSTPADHYVAVSCGPLFASDEYNKEIHHAIRLYLTPTQVPLVVKLLVRTFKTLWGLVQLPAPASSEDMDVDGPRNTAEVADPETALSLHVRLMAKVFSAIPSLDSATRLDLENLHNFLKPRILEQLVSQLEISSAHEEFSRLQAGIRAILSLGYCMDKLSRQWDLSFEPMGENVQEALGRVIRQKNVHPDLLLQAASVVLHNAAYSPSMQALDPSFVKNSFTGSVSFLLDHIEHQTKAAKLNEALWAGQSVDLPTPSHVAVALFDLLLGRWLVVLEHAAPDEVLRRLAKLMIQLSEVPTARPNQLELPSRGFADQPREFNASDVVWNTFASAEFWEMRRLRVAMMSTVVELTSDIDALPSLPQAPPARVNPDSLARHVACYRSMLHFPSEYFTKASKPILSARAVDLDSVISAATRSSASGLESEVAEWRVVVRTFIDRNMSPEILVKTPGILEHLVSTAEDQPLTTLPGNNELEKVTLRVVSKTFSTIATLTSGQDAESVRPLLESFVNSNLAFISQKGSSSLARLRSLFDLLDAFVEGTRCPKVDPSILALLDGLLEQLDVRLGVQLAHLPSLLGDPSVRGTTEASLVVDGKRVSTKFRGWRGTSHTIMPTSNVTLLPLLSQLLGRSSGENKSDAASFGIAVYRLLLEELQRTGDEGVEAAIACFVLLYSSVRNDEKLWRDMTSSLSESLRRCPIDQYSRAVALIADYFRISSAGKSPAGSYNLGALFRLSQVLIIDSPEGSGKHAHVLLQHSLLAMLGCSQLAGTVSGESLEECLALVFEAISFIERVCCEKSSFLREIEIGQILTILHNILSSTAPNPSPVFKPTSTQGIPPSSSLYFGIANILISLIRNQRELVRTHLPDFTKLLCLLISSLKTVHESLGARSMTTRSSAKSIGLVQSTLPWWVLVCSDDSQFKLDAKDARQLNRLLMSLSTKTFSKDPGGRRPRGLERTAKADSLASSFSNYATFVLIAYVRTITDTYHVRTGGLTTLDKSTRRELEEGISELCSMIGENRRDWVYQSLTSDGRSLFKGVWARYEKHRYTGMG